MGIVELPGTRLVLSPEQQEFVLGTLHAVLESPHFSKSKRYPALLEYAVRTALEGTSEPLKERTVGCEVFGRPADYDTSTDPVVRIAAGEVRRRMALYFSEHPETSVRIDLPHGSYKAEFHFKHPPANVISFQPPQTTIDAAPGRPHLVVSEIQPVPLDASHTLPPHTHVSFLRNTKTLVSLAAALFLMIAAVVFWRHQNDANQREFWRSVLDNNQPALILVGKSGLQIAQAASTSQPQPAPPVASDLALNDAIVTAQICSVFREYKRECTVSPSELAKVEDLHGKTVVLVGGFNNPWTRRLLAPLRYQLQSAPLADNHRIRQVIEHNPSGDISLGHIINDDPAADFAKDYAIIARFHSDITDGMAVVIAGLGRPGTSSAGQFVASPEEMRELLSRAPKGWQGTNFEAVLQIDLVQGSSNHVKVIASNFW